MTGPSTRSITRAVAVVVTGLGFAHGAAIAAVSNGSFLAGLSSWTPTGNAAADATSQFGPPMAPATAQAIVGTAATSSFLFGGAAVAVTTLETAVALAPGSLSGLGAVDGSAISQTFTASAGERLRFSWKLMSNEPQGAAANDIAFAVLDGSLVTLASVQTAALLGSSLSPMIDETAYASYLSAPLTPGSHTIAFGIADVPDSLGASALAITNVAAVPEPSTCGLLLVGLLLLPQLTRRRDGSY